MVWVCVDFGILILFGNCCRDVWMGWLGVICIVD